MDDDAGEDRADGPRETIEEYYDALRSGEPLHPFFADFGPVVKVGIGERMVGAGAVAEGLREQTRTTTDWVVESRDLRIGTVGGEEGNGLDTDDGSDERRRERVDAALSWFGDEVFVEWTDTERGIRFEFETRWSGALARVDATGEGDGGWRFVEMHVSTAGET